MKKVLLAIATTIATIALLTSCSPEEQETIDTPSIPTQDPVVATWKPLRYELYDVGETTPFETGNVYCGIIFTIDKKEDDTFRVRRTDCNGETNSNFRYTWIKTGDNTYAYRDHESRWVIVDGDMMYDNSGGWSIGAPNMVMIYEKVPPLPHVD